MSRQYATKPARLFKRPAKYARIDLGGEEELRQLGRSYLARPIHPIIAAAATLEMYDGNRRIAGVMLEDPDAEVPACLIDEAWNDSVKLEIQMESAAHTRDLSDYEQFAGCSQWLALNPTATAKDLAGRIHRDEAVVSKLLSLGRCVDAVKEAAMAGSVGYTVWHQLSKLSPAEQLAALAEGATRDQLQQRRQRNGNGRAATVKASSIPVVLTNGIAVTFKAEGLLTLAMALDAVAELKQAIKEGIDFDHDARTFAVLMKKRARELAKKG
jgi:ParB-like chromosome segregation protein Spo0J